MYKHQIPTVNLDGGWRSSVQVPPGVPVSLKYVTFTWLLRLPPPIHNAALVSEKPSKEIPRQQLCLSRMEELGFTSTSRLNYTDIHPLQGCRVIKLFPLIKGKAVSLFPSKKQMPTHLRKEITGNMFALGTVFQKKQDQQLTAKV